MEEEKVVLSVCMMTYNHEKYVEQAVKSVLAQKTNFLYELIIGDDASKDDTQLILSDICANDYRVKLVLRDINLANNIDSYTNFYDIRKRATGKYMCFIEGDDYWTDDYYLQNMVDFLDNNPSYYAICGHRSFLSERTDFLWMQQDCSTDGSDICLEDFINGEKSFDAMATVFRNFYSDGMFDYRDYLYDRLIGDITFGIHVLMHGPIYQSADVIGVYRTDRVRWSSSFNVMNGYNDKFRRHLNIIRRLSEDINEVDFTPLIIDRTKEYLEGIKTHADLEYARKLLIEDNGLFYLDKMIEERNDRLENSDSIICALTKEYEDLDDKYKLAIYWMKNRGKIVEYLKARNFKSVGIYGMRFFGECLFEELRNSDIEVSCIVDKCYQELRYPSLNVLSPDDNFPSFDVLIVTAYLSYDAIVEKMKKRTNAPIISLAKILYD